MHVEVQLQYWPVSRACKLKIHKGINYAKIQAFDTLTKLSHGHKDEHGEKVKRERKIWVNRNWTGQALHEKRNTILL